MNRSDTDPSYFALTITEMQSSVSVVASFKLRNYFANMASTDFPWRVVSHNGGLICHGFVFPHGVGCVSSWKSEARRGGQIFLIHPFPNLLGTTPSREAAPERP